MPLTNIHFLISIFSTLFGSTDDINQQHHLSSVLIMEEIPIERLSLYPNQGQMFLKDKPFTGISVAYYSNGQESEKISFLNGKRNGQRRKWFANGVLSYEAMYQSNKLHGVARSWWSNGQLRSKSHFTNGKSNGVQRQWYAGGGLFKESHIINGKEHGMQKAWRENGKIYVNYQAKDGRIFGLKRSNLCYELNSESIVNHE